MGSRNGEGEGRGGEEKREERGGKKRREEKRGGEETSWKRMRTYEFVL